MRRALLIGATTVALAAGAVGWGAVGDEPSPAQAEARTETFFGWVLGTREPMGVAIDAEPPGEDGTRRLRVYVCDGLGPPRGKAVWFTGRVDPRRANQADRGVTLRSASRRERLRIDHIDEHVVSGTFTDAAGRRRHFVASPATGGAGIYQVSLGRDLRYRGTSTQGHRLDAQARRDGSVKGAVTTVDGTRVDFRVRTLSMAPVADLRRNGFTREYRRDRARSLRPGQYVAVIAPGGSYWLGRSGNVRGGRSGNNIIGLDKAC